MILPILAIVVPVLIVIFAIGFIDARCTRDFGIVAGLKRGASVLLILLTVIGLITCIAWGVSHLTSPPVTHEQAEAQ